MENKNTTEEIQSLDETPIIAQDIPKYWTPEEVQEEPENEEFEELAPNEAILIHVPGAIEVYSYNSESKKYEGLTMAYECQIEKGVFNMPANSTDISPPICDEDHFAIFNESKKAWVIRKIEPVKESENPVVDKALLARNQRDYLLSQSDYTQLGDYPGDIIPAQKYRQSLRDITKQKGFPENIDWPELKKS